LTSALREIVLAPDERLTAPCEEADLDAARAIEADLVGHVSQVGVAGLAAPQVGELIRVIAVKKVPRERPITVMVNPEIVWRSPVERIGTEGCLSLPGKVFLVARHERIVVEYTTILGSPVSQVLDGLRARVVQHEIDHLDGFLASDLDLSHNAR
jgi:peptide deformylase